MATTKKASSSRTTSKTASTRKKAAPKTAVKSTKVTRVTAAEAPARNTAAGVGSITALRLDSNVLNIVIAELIGTFVLTMVALLTFQNVMPLYLGLTLAVLVLSIGAVSGSHVNPAVTFGLWAAGKVKSALLPFYWLAQFLGAMAALVMVNGLSGDSYGLNFGNFSTFSWGIFTVELVGTAIFLFGVTTVVSRVDLSAAGKAVGVGLSLMAGLLVAGSLLSSVQAGVDQSQIGFERNEESGSQSLTNVPHELRVKGATLNPAIALASSENTDSQLQSGQVADGETVYTRLSWEVLLSTLVGAAVGANLARLVNHRFKM